MRRCAMMDLPFELSRRPRTVKRTAPASEPHLRVQRLAAYCDQAESIILGRQDPVTGLLPASTATTVHGDYTHAWVRDNVYSILAPWALSLAYRKVDPARAHALAERVVALMRGLLAAMMRQASKVERFKHTQDPLDALHAKYDPRTGEPVVGDTEWGHLQLDATAIFLLFLAQMTVSGLRIVRTAGEVSFAQNLVYYLAEAYRTPDFGIWERGHKRNEGVAEINASSLGMVKAALEAIAGVQFLPGEAPAIHVVADDVARARDTLAALLPRESISKETDAALLAVIGFPAFAVEDASVVARTRTDIVAKLQGRYGCKRFLLDGHQTVVEDSGRTHYEPGELARFEHIESEWPLFFTYLLIDAALRGDDELAADYRARLEGLMQERDGQRLLPELYFVPADRVDAERAHPHSQERQPNDNVPLVWAQSLFLVGALLQEGYIDGADLDPLDRRKRPDGRSDVTVQVILLAEDELTQSRLAALGVPAETLAQVAPMRIRTTQELGAAFAQLGASVALGLTGRPLEPLGSLVSGQVFEIDGTTLVFLPAFFNRPRFYRTLDNRLLVDEIAAEGAYIRRHWRKRGQPVLALLIGQPMLDAQGADVLADFLRGLERGSVEGIAVRRLAAALAEAERQTIDWISHEPADRTAAIASSDVAAALEWEEAATRPLTAERAASLGREPDAQTLVGQLARSRNPYEQIALLGVLQQRCGADFALPLGSSVRQVVEALYARAARQRRWGVLRHAAGLLDLYDESLEEAVALIVAHQKRVSVGRTDVAGAIITGPCGNDEIVERIRSHGGDDPRARVLIQELILCTGTLIKTDPALFKGILTLRAWNLVQLLTGWLAREHGLAQAEAIDHLLDLSQQAVLGRLREVIIREREMTRNLIRQRWLRRSGKRVDLVRVSFPASADPVLEGEGGWAAWREMSGVIARRPEHFHARVHQLLEHCRGLVIGNPLDARNVVDSSIARADTTPGERGFGLHIEDLLSKIQEPAYRQLTVEALLAASDICRANDELQIEALLVMDELLTAAVALCWRRHRNEDEESSAPIDSDDVAQAWQLFYALEPHSVADFVMAAFALLLREPAEAQT